MSVIDTTPASRQSRQLHDASGRPVTGYVRRDTLIAEPWLGRVVRFFRPLERRYDPHSGCQRLVKRASVLFVGSDTWYESRNVFAKPVEGMPCVPLMTALRVTSHNHWWMSASGAPERQATLYEERMPETPPHEGWTLITSEAYASLVGYSKNTNWHVSSKSFTAQLDEALGKRQNIERAMVRAKRALNRQKAALWKAQQRVTKYETRIDAFKAKLDAIVLPTEVGENDSPSSD